MPSNDRMLSYSKKNKAFDGTCNRLPLVNGRLSQIKSDWVHQMESGQVDTWIRVVTYTDTLTLSHYYTLTLLQLQITMTISSYTMMRLMSPAHLMHKSGTSSTEQCPWSLVRQDVAHGCENRCMGVTGHETGFYYIHGCGKKRSEASGNWST